jgi:hypothetical protein
MREAHTGVGKENFQIEAVHSGSGQPPDTETFVAGVFFARRALMRRR